MSTYNPYDCPTKILQEKDKELALYKAACQRMVHISTNKDRKIINLTIDRDYWKEAIKAVAQIGGMKIAEEQGLLIKLPCKVGDTVFVNKQCFDSWYTFLEFKPYIRSKVVNFKYTKSGLKINIRPLTERTANCRYHKFFGVSSIGKTVFLTREAAEKALEGGDKAKHGAIIRVPSGEHLTGKALDIAHKSFEEYFSEDYIEDDLEE